jgi:hypothetical protein
MHKSRDQFLANYTSAIQTAYDSITTSADLPVPQFDKAGWTLMGLFSMKYMQMLFERFEYTLTRRFHRLNTRRRGTEWDEDAIVWTSGTFVEMLEDKIKNKFGSLDKYKGIDTPLDKLLDQIIAPIDIEYTLIYNRLEVNLPQSMVHMRNIICEVLKITFGVERMYPARLAYDDSSIDYMSVIKTSNDGNNCLLNAISWHVLGFESPMMFRLLANVCLCVLIQKIAEKGKAIKNWKKYNPYPPYDDLTDALIGMCRVGRMSDSATPIGDGILTIMSLILNRQIIIFTETNLDMTYPFKVKVGNKDHLMYPTLNAPMLDLRDRRPICIRHSGLHYEALQFPRDKIAANFTDPLISCITLDEYIDNYLFMQYEQLMDVRVEGKVSK